MRVIDLCCGDGYFTAAIARRIAPGQVVGVDLDPDMLAQAQAACGEARQLRLGRGRCAEPRSPGRRIRRLRAYRQHVSRRPGTDGAGARGCRGGEARRLLRDQELASPAAGGDHRVRTARGPEPRCACRRSRCRRWSSLPVSGWSE
ncbi:MAG: class I SAM-dependent methyltransferase [Comamonadaceae bacterium]|nr:class I SAM-dependent methyltransferase [Comamonadaceae bacterium]